MNLISIIKQIEIFGTPVIFWLCYWYVGFNEDYVKVLLFAYALLILIFNNKIIINQLSYSIGRKISLLIGCFFLSSLSAFVLWGQGISLSYRAGVGSFVLIYYFILKKYDVSRNELEKLLLFFSVIYVALWLYALYMAPIVVFGNLDEVSEDRGFIRVLQLNSMDVATLCYFVCLHKAVSSSSKKVIWIIISIILFLVILLSLSRIVLLAMIVGTIFYLLKRKAYKTITILMIVGTISFGAILQTDVVSGMIELTKNQAESKSENDFRLIEYQHAFDAYPINPISIVFGNGHSHVASSLGKYDQKLQKRMGYDRVDAGFVGLYATYGLIGVLLIFSIFYKALIKKCASEDLPYKCFIIFLIITNIMAFTIFSYGIAFMIALYMLFKDEPLRIKHSKHSTSLCSI